MATAVIGNIVLYHLKHRFQVLKSLFHNTVCFVRKGNHFLGNFLFSISIFRPLKKNTHSVNTHKKIISLKWYLKFQNSMC